MPAPALSSAASNSKGAPPACQLFDPAGPDLPLLVASAHSARHYPDEFVRGSRLPLEALRRSEDCFVDELFGPAPALGASLLCASFPRAYCDANREKWELDPSMFLEPLPSWCNTGTERVRAGFGTIARLVSHGEPIYNRKLSFREAESRILSCWEPYHATLSFLIARSLSRHGLCLLLDCHSMPRGTPHRSARDVDIVLGDAYSTSCAPMVTRTVQRQLEAEGLRVQRNHPYAGGYVTRHYGRPLENVHVLQIELSRPLYMTEETFLKHEGFDALQGVLSRLVQTLAVLSQDMAKKRRCRSTAKFREETSKKQRAKRRCESTI
ncbi:N-formylglutamate amidohydrolase [Rhizosaccharibacter radicis]|uniref:N-formylglutamate amidohydrolase n=1 Tax=Rhizosaccharibacter radicis TaxID=2782605 RepID=A0ABT1W1J2_9PROT|nr:N-formylglutamate amidohydrolase [Acetobacteraceae bacterium KSS12]